MEYEIDGQTISVGDVMPDKPAWKTILNGEDITSSVKGLACVNEAMGIGFLYGASMTGGAYNQGHLYNRGGAVIVIRNGYFVAVLEQVRPLQKSEPIYEFPRGQADFGEKPEETALRELFEETGIDQENVLSLEHLGSGNPDNALILGENVHFVLVDIHESAINWESGTFKRGTFRPDASSRLSEGIKGAKIVSLKGFKSPSMMTMAAVGFLKANY